MSRRIAQCSPLSPQLHEKLHYRLGESMMTRRGEVEGYRLLAPAAADDGGGRWWRPSVTEPDLARREDRWTVLLTMPPCAAEMIARMVISSRRRRAIRGACPRAHSLAPQRAPFHSPLGRRRFRLHRANTALTRHSTWESADRLFGQHRGRQGHESNDRWQSVCGQ